MNEKFTLAFYSCAALWFAGFEIAQAHYLSIPALLIMCGMIFHQLIRRGRGL